MPMFEVEISRPDGQLRVVTVCCKSANDIWRSVRLQEGESAVTRELAELKSDHRPTIDASDTAPTPASSPGPETTPARPVNTSVHNKAIAPIPRKSNARAPAANTLADRILELVCRCWVIDESMPESLLDGSSSRPSTIVPASIVARRGLSVLYWCIAILAVVRAVQARVPDHEKWMVFAVYLASGLFGWMLVIALVRYALFVYPWERARRGRAR